jgi:hypothetical protein
MLDWNHILLKDLVSPAEMQAFWAQVTPTQEEPDPS